MDNEKIFSSLDDFDYKETKNSIVSYFTCLEKLRWELAKLEARQGLTANYDLSIEYKKQPYSPVGKDIFNISAREYKEEQLKTSLSSYYWAKNALSSKEQIYINEHFYNHKYEDDLLELLGFSSKDSKEFRRLKKSAVYKFADFLNLLVEKEKNQNE